MAEKTEEPTDQKLEDARKKGQVAVSRDLARCIMILPLGEIAFGMEALWRDAVHRLFDGALRWNEGAFGAVMPQIVTSALLLCLVSILVCAVVVVVTAVAGHWGQYGVLVAPEAMAINFEKFDPVSNAKGLFSAKKLMEIGLSLAKLLVVGLITWLVLRHELPHFVALAGGAPEHMHKAGIDILHALFRVLVGAMLAVSVIDYFIQKHAHIKGLRMSMDEIFREYKENNGDPMVKGERKALARELLDSDPVQATGSANAVVVNPTHFAVALFYHPTKAPVPHVKAKGADQTAKAMIERAHRLSIPVIRHVWLARALYAVGKPDVPIPASAMQVAAMVYAVALEMQERGGYAALDTTGSPPPELRRH